MSAGTWPAKFFESATLGATFDPGELAPEELIQHEVARRLLADSLIADMFGGRVYATAGLQRLDGLAGERLYVTLSTNDVEERPTVLDWNRLQVYIVARRELTAQSRPMVPGEAGAATVLAYIRKVLNKHDSSGVNNKMLPVTLSGGAVPALVTESNAGPISFQETPVDGGVWIGDAIQPWIYRVKVNHDTGHIQSLDDSGAYA